MDFRDVMLRNTLCMLAKCCKRFYNVHEKCDLTLVSSKRVVHMYVCIIESTKVSAYNQKCSISWIVFGTKRQSKFLYFLWRDNIAIFEKYTNFQIIVVILGFFNAAHYLNSLCIPTFPVSFVTFYYNCIRNTWYTFWNRGLWPGLFPLSRYLLVGGTS